VQPPLFYGEHELSLDDKSRLLVPSEVRRRVDPAIHGEAFFLILGVNRHVWLYPEKVFESIVARRRDDLSPDEDELAFDQMHFALTVRLEPDKQGRVLIPEKHVRRTGLQKELTLVGVREHLELWNRDEWDQHREGLLDNRADITRRAKNARSQGGSTQD